MKKTKLNDYLGIGRDSFSTPQGSEKTPSLISSIENNEIKQIKSIHYINQRRSTSLFHFEVVYT